MESILPDCYLVSCEGWIKASVKIKRIKDQRKTEEKLNNIELTTTIRGSPDGNYSSQQHLGSRKTVTTILIHINAKLRTCELIVTA